MLHCFSYVNVHSSLVYSFCLYCSWTSYLFLFTIFLKIYQVLKNYSINKTQLFHKLRKVCVKYLNLEYASQYWSFLSRLNGNACTTQYVVCKYRCSTSIYIFCVHWSRSKIYCSANLGSIFTHFLYFEKYMTILNFLCWDWMKMLVQEGMLKVFIYVYISI